jgi:hypothetical protein
VLALTLDSLAHNIFISEISMLPLDLQILEVAVSRILFIEAYN